MSRFIESPEHDHKANRKMSKPFYSKYCSAIFSVYTSALFAIISFNLGRTVAPESENTGCMSDYVTLGLLVAMPILIGVSISWACCDEESDRFKRFLLEDVHDFGESIESKMQGLLEMKEKGELNVGLRLWAVLLIEFFVWASYISQYFWEAYTIGTNFGTNFDIRAYSGVFVFLLFLMFLMLLPSYFHLVLLFDLDIAGSTARRDFMLDVFRKDRMEKERLERLEYHLYVKHKPGGSSKKTCVAGDLESGLQEKLYGKVKGSDLK